LGLNTDSTGFDMRTKWEHDPW
jgi:hypothetical protein